jgi:hypothetical protein
VFYGVFIAQEVDRVGHRGSGDAITVGVQTFLEAFLNMSLRYAHFTDEAFFFSGRSKTFALGTGLLEYWIVRISRLSDSRLKEFCGTK